MKPLKVKGYEGNGVQYIELFGDPKKQAEPSEVRVYYPGGYLSVTRTTDNEYWVHVGLRCRTDEDDGSSTIIGKVVDARIDLIDGLSKNLGDLNNSELEHLALRIAKLK